MASFGFFEPHQGDWDPTVYIDPSPLMPFIGKNRAIWQCPADPVKVSNNLGVKVQRVRDNSMSQVFDFGRWLVSIYYTPSPGPYLCYGKMSDIRRPSDTWVFGEEHPNSINDGAMAVQMYGNSGDPAPKIVDIPGSWHAGVGVFALADGHCLTRKWLGSVIKPPVSQTADYPLPYSSNPDAGSIKDLIWWSSITTVHNSRRL